MCLLIEDTQHQICRSRGGLTQRAKEGDQERDGEIHQDPVEDGYEHQFIAATAGDDGQGRIHRGSSSGTDRG